MPFAASTLRTGPHAVSLFHHGPAQGQPSPPELPRYKVASYLSIKRLLGCLVLWPGPLLITKKEHSEDVLRDRERVSDREREK